MALLIKAGQMTASDYVPTYPDLLLASEGASTDAIGGSLSAQTKGAGIVALAGLAILTQDARQLFAGHALNTR
jgi:hypothetical protein